MSVKPGENDSEDPSARLWKAGAEITGSTAGGVLGAILAGPEGAVLGAAAGTTIGSALKEFTHRLLGRRERVRIGATLQYAAYAYQQRLEAGDYVRSDGFFDGDAGNRSPADEILEGVLIVAQRQHEERKIEYLGYLLANLAFEPQVDINSAHWLIKIAEELTWTQLVILNLIGASDHSALPDIDIGASAGSWRTFNVHAQIADLGYSKREMIGAPSKKTENYSFIMPNLALRDHELKGVGKLLYYLMWLNRIPDADRSMIIAALQELDEGSGC